MWVNKCTEVLDKKIQICYYYTRKTLELRVIRRYPRQCLKSPFRRNAMFCTGQPVCAGLVIFPGDNLDIGEWEEKYGGK